MKEQLKKIYRLFSPSWQKLYMEYPVEFKPRFSTPPTLNCITSSTPTERVMLTFCMKQ